MKNKINFLILAFSVMVNPCFAESLDLTLNSDAASQTTGTDSQFWDAGAAEPYDDESIIFLGYGSKPSITFKKDGRIIDSEGKEITRDIELVKKLREALNGNCK